MSLLIDCQCFPCISFFLNLIKHKHISLDIYEHFQKMSFRNRYLVASANGIVSLSIPIKGGREQKILMKDVEINNTINWQTIHCRTILSAYSRAPFYDYYANEVEELLRSGEENLILFNKKIIDYCVYRLNINALVDFTTFYETKSTENFDLRNQILPKNYTAFVTPGYLQVFQDRQGFKPNLSILDLLFCEGPNAGRVLKDFVKNKG